MNAPTAALFAVTLLTPGDTWRESVALPETYAHSANFGMVFPKHPLCIVDLQRPAVITTQCEVPHVDSGMGALHGLRAQVAGRGAAGRGRQDAMPSVPENDRDDARMTATLLSIPVSPPTGADGPESEPQAHLCEVAGGCYVWDLEMESPAIPITRAEGEFALGVWLMCEVRGAVLTPYRRLADVRNTHGSGAAGQAQVMELHRPRMASMGLDFEQEYHRVLYAFWMHQTSGPGPWSCKGSAAIGGDAE